MRRLILFLLGVVCSQQLYAQQVTVESAAEHFQKGRWKEAAEAYTMLTKQDPSNVTLWSNLGVSLYSLKQYSQAAEALEQAHKIRPMVATMYNLACVYSLMDQKQQSLDWLQKAAEGGLNMPANMLQDEDLKNVKMEKRFDEILTIVQKNATPCEFDEKYRRFDFWVGEWNVKNHLGRPVGKSRIEKILGGCVILENWTGVTGYEGKSFNFIDPVTGAWRQTWVDSRGGKIEFTGSFNEQGDLVYYADGQDANGNKFRRRLTFSNLGAGQVRQFSQRSVDGEKTWTVEYDFTYTRN